MSLYNYIGLIVLLCFFCVKSFIKYHLIMVKVLVSNIVK